MYSYTWSDLIYISTCDIAVLLFSHIVRWLILFSLLKSQQCVCVCVCVWLAFYVAFNNIFNYGILWRWLLVAWDARNLIIANTDVPYRRHKTRVHHPVTLSWHRANQFRLYPLSAERLAKKQQVPILTPLVWGSQDSNPGPPNFEANALTAGPPSPLCQFFYISFTC